MILMSWMKIWPQSGSIWKMKIVTNSTPLIALSRINELNILRDIFGEITAPMAVYREVVLEGAGRPGVRGVANAHWIIKGQVQDPLAVSLLKTDLNDGEAEAIVAPPPVCRTQR
jgi:predicted nucleic acid-binding protein